MNDDNTFERKLVAIFLLLGAAAASVGFGVLIHWGAGVLVAGLFLFILGMGGAKSVADKERGRQL